MRFSISSSAIAGSLLLFSTFATAIPTTEAARASIAPREPSTVKIQSRAAESIGVVEKRADDKPVDPELEAALKVAIKEHQKPGIGQVPTSGIDPGLTSGLVIGSIVIMFYGSLIWFTTEDEQ